MPTIVASQAPPHRIERKCRPALELAAMRLIGVDGLLRENGLVDVHDDLHPVRAATCTGRLTVIREKHLRHVTQGIGTAHVRRNLQRSFRRNSVRFAVRFA
jgi:hypothetical protein